MSTHDDTTNKDNPTRPDARMVSHHITSKLPSPPFRAAHCECGRQAIAFVDHKDHSHVLGYYCVDCGMLHHSQFIYDEETE